MTVPTADYSEMKEPPSDKDQAGENAAAPEPGASDPGTSDMGKAPTPEEILRGEQSWRNLLELDAQLFKHKNVRLLTPEARVLIHLRLEGSMPVSAAMQLAGVSYRGFYAVLERLKQAGLVGQAKDDADQRVRNLTLAPSNPIPPAKL